jgi:hypothetical protein
MLNLPPIHQFANTDDLNDCAQFANSTGQRLLIWSLTGRKDFFLRVFSAGDGYFSYLIESRDDLRGSLAEDFAEPEEEYKPVTEESVRLLESWGLKL